jgi:hypothetical protein
MTHPQSNTASSKTDRPEVRFRPCGSEFSTEWSSTDMRPSLFCQVLNGGVRGPCNRKCILACGAGGKENSVIPEDFTVPNVDARQRCHDKAGTKR